MVKLTRRSLFAGNPRLTCCLGLEACSEEKSKRWTADRLEQFHSA